MRCEQSLLLIPTITSADDHVLPAQQLSGALEMEFDPTEQSHISEEGKEEEAEFLIKHMIDFNDKLSRESMP